MFPTFKLRRDVKQFQSCTHSTNACLDPSRQNIRTETNYMQFSLFASIALESRIDIFVGTVLNFSSVPSFVEVYTACVLYISWRRLLFFLLLLLLLLPCASATSTAFLLLNRVEEDDEVKYYSFKKINNIFLLID